MTNGPIFRSPNDIAEAIATRIGTGGQTVDRMAALRAAETQERVDAIIRRESELGVFELEAVRELGKWTI